MQKISNFTVTTKISVIILIFASSFVFSGEEDDTPKRRSLFAFPVVYYTTDTGIGGGLGGIKSYNPDRVRISIVTLSLVYTEKNQTIIGSTWDHQFSGNKDRVIFKWKYTKYPTIFFGMGNKTANDNPEKYTPEFFTYDITYERLLVKKLKMRIKFFLRNQALIKYDPEGVLKSSQVPWNKGRLDAGPVISLLWDSRDNIFAANRGTLAKLEYRGIAIQDEGSSFNTLSLDLRHFINLFSESVLGFMMWFEDTRGDVPFYLFSTLGSNDRLRGYEEDRFRGKSVLLFQNDFRFPLWGSLGGAVFASTGRVADYAGELFSGKYHTGYGTGLRYFYNKKENLAIRFDFAFGEDSNGIYITFAEAF